MALLETNNATCNMLVWPAISLGTVTATTRAHFYQEELWKRVFLKIKATGEDRITRDYPSILRILVIVLELLFLGCFRQSSLELV